MSKVFDRVQWNLLSLNSFIYTSLKIYYIQKSLINQYIYINTDFSVSGELPVGVKNLSRLQNWTYFHTDVLYLDPSQVGVKADQPNVWYLGQSFSACIIKKVKVNKQTVYWSHIWLMYETISLISLTSTNDINCHVIWSYTNEIIIVKYFKFLWKCTLILHEMTLCIDDSTSTVFVCTYLLIHHAKRKSVDISIETFFC